MTEPTLPSTVRHIFEGANGGRKFHHFSALFRVDGIKAGLVHPFGLRFLSPRSVLRRWWPPAQDGSRESRLESPSDSDCGSCCFIAFFHVVERGGTKYVRV